jgi:hypothetical protein
MSGFSIMNESTKGGVRVAPPAQLKTKLSRTVGSLIILRHNKDYQ